jgi:hypothetical protein
VTAIPSNPLTLSQIFELGPHLKSNRVKTGQAMCLSIGLLSGMGLEGFKGHSPELRKEKKSDRHLFKHKGHPKMGNNLFMQ